MPPRLCTCQSLPGAHAGFGLIDALVALALLAVTLLGACGSLHFAMRANRAAAWQSQAVDLVADLDEDLQQSGTAGSQAAQLETWRLRLQRDLPAAQVAGLQARRVAAGAASIDWIDVTLAWNATPGMRRQTLEVPLAQAGAP